MRKEKIINLIKEVLTKERRIVFAYIYGSFITAKDFRDIDIGIYLRNPVKNPYVVSSDIKIDLSRLSKKRGLKFTADDFDVRVINDAPFTFLKRVFEEGILIIDYDPELRTDIIERVSLKYRECAGLLAESSLI